MPQYSARVLGSGWTMLNKALLGEAVRGVCAEAREMEAREMEARETSEDAICGGGVGGGGGGGGKEGDLFLLFLLFLLCEAKRFFFLLTFFFLPISIDPSGAATTSSRDPNFLSSVPLTPSLFAFDNLCLTIDEITAAPSELLRARS